MKFKSSLSIDILEKRISVEKYLGVKDYVWCYQDALEVIEYCRNHYLFIYGGDVMRRETNGNLDYTYDNWGLNEDPNGDNILESVEQSIEYIKKYPAKETFFYSLTIAGM